MMASRGTQAPPGQQGAGAKQSFPVVISGPSGVGKSSIAAWVIEREPGLRLSVSVTTRRRRSGEIDGRDYVFLAREEFERQRTSGALVEWAEVHGNFYGTPRELLEDVLAAGYEVLLDIDYQGGLKIRESYPEAALVFVLPPSWEALEARLRGRGSDAEEDVRRRLNNAARELDHAHRYDYFVVNDEIARAGERIRAILAAERQRAVRLSTELSLLLSDARRGACTPDPAPGAAPA